MGIFGNKHKQSGLSAVFDIESGSIGVALVRFVDGSSQSDKAGTKTVDTQERPEVIWTVREEFLFQENISWKRLLGSMYDALGVVIERLNSEGLEKARTILKKSHKLTPDKIFCIFSSPWYSSATKLLHIEKEKPFIVDENFFKQIQQNTAAGFNKTNQSQTGSNKEASEYETLEQAIINIRLNGYEVIKPLGKMAKKADLAVFVAETHTDVAQKVLERINSFFPDVEISVHACALALYTILRNIFPAQQSGLMVHVTGEVTDLSLFKDGILMETVSFPFGSHSIIRMAAVSTGTAPAELRSILKLAGTGEGGELQRAKAQKALDKAHLAWAKHWREAISHLGDEIGLLPRQVFVFSQGEFAQAYSKWINKEVFGLLNSSAPFRTTSVLSPFLRKYIVPSGATEDRDLLLDIESIYLRDALSTSAWL